MANESVAERFRQVREAYDNRDYRLCRDELDRVQELAPAEPEIHRWLARLAWHDCAWTTTRDSAEALLRSSPDDREMVQLKARACNNLKLWPEAADAWEHLTHLRPNWPEGLYQLARAQLRSGQRSRSLRSAARLCELASSDPEAGLLAARFYVEAGDTAKAVELYVRFGATEESRLSQELAGFEKSGNLHGLAAVLVACRRVSDSDELQTRASRLSEELIRRAFVAERAGKLGEAHTDFTAATALALEDVLALRSMARIIQKLHAIAQDHLQRQELVEAANAYDAILQHAPYDPRAALQRGKILMQLQQWDRAAEAWLAFCELAPNDIAGRVQYARAMERAECFAGAGLAWRAVLEIDPPNAEAVQALSRLPGRMIKAGRNAVNEHRYAEAYDFFSGIAQDCAEFADAQRRMEQLGRYIRKENRSAYKEAHYLKIVRNSEAAMRLLPDDADVHKVIAKAAMRSSNYDIAAAAWRRVSNISPAPDYSHRLDAAKCYLKLGKLDEGQLLLEEVLRQQPHNERARELELDFRAQIMAAARMEKSEPSGVLEPAATTHPDEATGMADSDADARFSWGAEFD